MAGSTLSPSVSQPPHCPHRRRMAQLAALFRVSTELNGGRLIVHGARRRAAGASSHRALAGSRPETGTAGPLEGREAEVTFRTRGELDLADLVWLMKFLSVGLPMGRLPMSRSHPR